MKKWKNLLLITITLYLLIPSSIMAYSDSDFDGVADEHDLCPNSTMLDIVDKTGCTIEKLVLPKTKDKKKLPNHFNVILGLNQIKDNKSINKSFQLNYLYKKLSLNLQTNSYQNGGQGDTVLGFYYKFRVNPKLSYKIGSSLVFPTYKSQFDNNNMDYRLSINLNYYQNRMFYFGGVTYNIINDDDINKSNYNINYQNSINYYFGTGSYFINNLYSSLSYTSSSSVYKNGNNISSLSLYNYYSITNNWFTNFGYLYGIDKSSDQINIGIGYKF